jgi:hypothetical protein
LNVQTLNDLHAPGDGFLEQARVAKRALFEIAEILELDGTAKIEEVITEVDRLKNGSQLELPGMDL